MNQYNAIEDQPVLETPKTSPSTSIKKLVGASVVLSFALGACAATALSYRAAGVTDLAVTENCKLVPGLAAIMGFSDYARAATAESACSPFILPAKKGVTCPADPSAPVSMGPGEFFEAFQPEKIVIWGAMCGDGTGENGGGVKAQYGVQGSVWVKGPMMDKAKIEINGVGVGGDLFVQAPMTGDASIFIDAGGGVRNLIVQAEMSGNAKITVVGEVSGSITVASMSGNAKIEAGSCAKSTTKTGTITGSAAITGTGC